MSLLFQNRLLNGAHSISHINTAWKVSKYGFLFGPYFAVFRLNTGKYGPEKIRYLDTFHAVKSSFRRCCVFWLIYGTMKTWFSLQLGTFRTICHWLISTNSSLTVLNNVFILLCSKNKLVLPANIIATSTCEELGRC